MAMTNNLLKYLGEQIAAADTTWTYLKNEAANDTLTWDKFFQSTSKFWIGSLASCWDLYPFAEGTPVVYATVGHAALNYAGTPFAVEAIPADKVPLLTADLITVKAANAAAAGTPVPSVQPDGTLQIDVNTLANLTAGDVFLVAVHYPLTGGATKTVALMVLSVT